MAEPAVRRVSATGTDQSIGDLVSVATRDISQLVRYEMDLAKIELKSDVKRLAIGGALLAIGGFVACLVLVLLSFAFALGLYTLGIWLWASFLIAAGACVLLTGLSVLIGITMVRKMNGMSKTRKSLADGVSVLRRQRPAAAKSAVPKKAAGAGAKATSRAI
jgi:Putative Actinobacterial Holin-X, holin superfamily III